MITGLSLLGWVLAAGLIAFLIRGAVIEHHELAAASERRANVR